VRRLVRRARLAFCIAIASLAQATFTLEARAQAGPPSDAGDGDYASLGELLTRRGGGEFSAHAETGVGLVLSSYQREQLGFDQLLQGTARLGLSLSPSLSAQLSAGSVLFFADEGASGQAFTVLQGIRFALPLAGVGCGFADANFGLAESVRRARVALDAGLGFEFPVLAYVELGPFARYHHVFSATPDAGGDARFFSVGIAGTVRRLGWPRPARRGPSDTDGDGVLDRDDHCPLTPSEPDPDPRKPGCPATDRDRDGWLDPVDHCPGVRAQPHPNPARPGCPDGDDDRDGVRNQLDACPRQKPEPVPDPARQGCPAGDRDYDKIADPIDACPDQAGVASADPKRNGCPALVEVERERLRTLAPVFFATGEERILPASEPLLRDIAEALRNNPAIRISIEGHTDDTGTDAHNLELSTRRAESVRRALIELGIDAARLEARGFGRSRPIAPGTTAEAREKNRRVELRVLPAPDARQKP
jgi:outer membrane protein OmpA-like peptidoglycan-associated protein